MSSIWTDDFLNKINDDAGNDILDAEECLFHKFYLAITAGISTYTLPSKVRSLRKIKYRGITIDELSWQEFMIINPMSAFVDSGDKIEVPQSRPRFYAFHPTNNKQIRFYPCPDETLSASGGDPYSPLINEARCNITCWRNIDETITDAYLPAYIDKRTRKAFVLWKAFGKEGKGQNLRAADYYKQKYDYLLARFKVINTKAFVSKIYSLSGSSHRLFPRKPRLPSNFEMKILH